MKVTHIYHSGVIVETDRHLLLFDYYQGDLQLDPTKPLYVFSSHRHPDHFHSAIFQIQHPNIHYILSDDIKTSHQAYFVSPHQTYQIDDLMIHTLLSTDEGVAFIVEVDQQTIFHAGDLHLWYWKDESEKFNHYQITTFQKEINSIQQPIDIAFIVVDDRLEENYLMGLQYILKTVQCHNIFPIHYFGNYRISQQLKNENLDNPYQAHIFYIEHENQIFEL